MRFPLFYLVPKATPKCNQESEERIGVLWFVFHTAHTAGACLDIPGVQFRLQYLAAMASAPMESVIAFYRCVSMLVTLRGAKLIVTVDTVESFPLFSILIGNMGYNLTFSCAATALIPVTGII